MTLSIENASTKFEDPDIPTVRVPASNTTFRTGREFTYTRGPRTVSFSRGGNSWRISGRSFVVQQEDKRPSGSQNQFSRKYRGQRTQYRDDKNSGSAAPSDGRSDNVTRISPAVDTCTVDERGTPSGAPIDYGNYQFVPRDNRTWNGNVAPKFRATESVVTVLPSTATGPKCNSSQLSLDKRDARISHSQRASASPSTHSRHGANFRDVEHHEESNASDQRRIASVRDGRRYSSTQKFRHTAGSGYHRQRDYLHENRFSDGEQAAPTTDGLHTRRLGTSSQLVSKPHGREPNADHTERNPETRSPDDKEEQAETTVPRGRGGSKFHSNLNSRGSRTAFSRGGSSWRTSGKSLVVQQENRRSSASHSQISRRYRGQRDHYDDGKGGEGGAAAGGAGHSNTGGEGASSMDPSGACGVDGYNNLSGNQKSGGNQESGPANNHREGLAASVATTSFTESVIIPSSAVTSVGNRGSTRLLSDKANVTRFDRDRKHHERGVSTPGLRSNGDRHFFRMNNNRENKPNSDRCRLNLAHIPPLMSIRPRGLFTYSEHSLDSVTGDASESPINEPLVIESADDLASGDNCASDADSLPSDGFTKVVSKSSRKLARKRLQHESPFNKPTRLQSFPAPDTSCSRTFHFASSCKSSDISTSRTSQRFKGSPFKPTFMGPPLSTISSVSTVSFGASWATSDYASAETAENWSSRTRVRLSADPPNIQMPGSRTWSKVVGSKFTAMDSEGPRHALLDHPRGPKWSGSTTRPTTDTITPTLQTTLPVNSCSKLVSPVASVSLTDTSTSGAIEYGSVQRLWSSSCVGQNEFPTTSAETISMQLSTSAPAVVRVGASTVLADSNTTRTSGSTVTNNICKVRPQQQQNSQSNVLQSKTPVAAPLVTTAVISDQNTITATPASERVVCEGDASDGDYGVLRGSQPHSTLDAVSVPSANFSPSSTHVSWVDNLTPQVQSNFYATRVGMENAFTANVWPASDSLLDNNSPGVIPCTGVGRTYHSSAEAVPNAGPSSNPTVFSDSSYKQPPPAALLPRTQAYAIQHYAAVGSSDFSLSYDVPLTETTKFVSADTAHPQPVFSHLPGSVYLSPDQQSNSQAHFTNWGLPPNQHSQVPQPLTQQRYRPRISHQPDASFGNFPYQPELQNEFTYLPSVTGCVPPLPSGGLYSTVHDHSQPSYPHGSSRHNMESVGNNNPWSIFGTPPCSSNLQTPGQDFMGSSAHAPAGSGAGLLPHPAAQNGYGSISCSVAPGPSSSHQNYVGVIGGGRISTDIPDTSLRQRGLSPNIYPTHISHSAQNQQPLQVHSAFYPSLSPSHQRIQLHHCRGNMHNLMNPQTGLYAAAFGAPSQSAQPTPPPLQSRIAYPSMANDSSLVPPMSFHSQLQPHSFPNVALQPGVHGPRGHQSSAPHLTRNLGSLTNHATSPLLIPGAVGPTGLPGYAQPSPSLSGYSFKHVLPTL